MKQNKIDATLASIAAILVLFSAMIGPIYSVTIALVFLIGFILYKFWSD